MTVLGKIRATIKQNGLLSPGDKIVVGVSGGPDSLALLHLLLALRDEWQTQLHVAHLNHQLRGAESEADAEFVNQLAHEWGLPSTIESRDVDVYAREKKGSVEEAAREMRYAFLMEVAQHVGARSVAVAHNADDQVETALIHLLRGSGLAGLRGMLYKTDVSRLTPYVSESNPQPPISNLFLVRPLLDVTRAEIETYCKENSLTPRFDRSNLDTTLFRNRLRHEVLPYLEALNPNLRKILLHTSRSISDDYDYLESQALAAFVQITHKRDDEIVFHRDAWSKLHPALQRLTLRSAIQQLRRDLRNIDWIHIEDARRDALEKGTGAVATLPHGLRLIVGYGEFIIREGERESLLPDMPQLNVDCLPLPTRGAVGLPQSDWVVEVHSSSLPLASEGLTLGRGWTAALDAQKIVGQTVLRRRRAGDRFQPSGMGGHSKSIHEFMIDEKIPRFLRERLPLLQDGEKILWVCRHRMDERARVTDATREVLLVTFKKSSPA